MAISVNSSRNPSSSSNPAAADSSSTSSSSRIRLNPSSPTISGAKADSSRALSGRQSNGSTGKRIFSQRSDHRGNENGANRTASKSTDHQSIHRRTSELSKTNNAPLASITNRSASSSYDDEMQSSRKMPSASGAAIAAALRASGDTSNDAGDGSSDRIHAPRSSQGTNRSISNRIPSALRRLPPGGSRIASRSIMPSGAYPGTDPAMPSSSSSHQSGSSMRSAPTALARANGRRSLGATLNAAAAGGAAQHDRDGRELNKLTVDSTSFEEWMKMATDNKINATNTWNFALIDYFHDMSLLKSENGDGSINFQKASCTLDGCVKVWTSRVDSVVVETGKLLSGLQDEGKESNTRGGRGRNADEEDGEGEEDIDGSGQKKKKARSREPTLVKSFNQLAVKKLDLEFTVDPLFKKTSADFDEGGAGGLLMNHLGVDSKARVVFDASDVPGQDDVEESETPVVVEDEDLQSEVDQEDEGDMTETELTSRNDKNGDFIDLTKIRTKLFGQNDFAIGQEDALGTLLTEMTVCPTFASFRFAPDDNTPFSELMAENENRTSIAPSFGFDTMTQSNTWDNEPLNDGAVFDDGMDDAFGDVGGGAMTGFNAGSAEPFDYQEASFDDGEEGGNLFTGEGSAQPQGPPDFSSLQGILNNSSDQPFEGDDFFGYFDQKMSKNWAGPEHWKMRNVMAPTAAGANATAGGAPEKAARKQKEPFVIDFTSSEGAVTSKELFETGKGQAGTLLPASKDFDDLYLLPEDRHFSSKQLLRLFIKPRAMLNPRRQGQMLDERAGVRTNEEADYWIQAAAQNGGLEGQGGAALGFDDDDDVGMPVVPFDTQFFHEDDDGGFDPMGEATENAMALEPEDEELATQALKRIRPEFVNYTKVAKRVDIRKLKENIWRELAIFAADEEEDPETSGEQSGSGMGDERGRQSTPKPGDSMDLDKSSLVKRDPTDPRTFDAVLSGLRKLYPKDRMDEISTSYCFICLLHLANEEGLQIQAGSSDLSMLAGKMIVEDDEDDDDAMDVPELLRNVKRASHNPFDDVLVDEEDPDQYRVGYLGQLSIAKDLTAGRSA
ncbi:uncharacterized protein FA14DRAFT_159755 [Meira miltonrushii]|uniref:Condensin complex subunit 2 n=1 Tax=Meira miltonrushii TaxID=1280837 RepID=A0A316VK24_9BASI|nr:uncharacterized protein FA14DRAFT_159755 [Meira miltonrushii]PWN37959.1 hypothetical protein FA14DRAFT_159755 [Meira miltonrushii]